MQVKATNGLSGPSKTPKRGRSSGDGHPFEIDFGSPAEETAKTSRPQATGAIDTLLSLQEVQPFADEQQQAVNDSNRMLDLLDGIKADLLAGRMDAGRLTSLEGALSRYRTTVADPGLHEIVKAIDLRARVELAKLGRGKA